MNRVLPLVMLTCMLPLFFIGCGGNVEANLKSEEPPPAVVEEAEFYGAGNS